MGVINILFVFMLSGCSGLVVSGERKQMYEQGYREGVREQMGRAASRFEGNRFPYYEWSAPAVQQVRIPAHLEGGMFVPQHNELVIVKPGEWMQQASFPIDHQEKTNEDTLTIKADNPKSADITYLPNNTSQSR